MGDSNRNLHFEGARRGAAEEAEAAPVEGPEDDQVEAAADEPVGNGAGAEEIERSYLQDLQRLQADFENYRKRMMRAQSEIGARAGAHLLERLLPVLDNFDRALEHEPSPGIEMVRRELMEVLRSEGLERIEAGGAPFDPHVHEAVESHEQPGVDEPTVTAVHRAGYLFKDKVLRPAMVAVARPVEEPSREKLTGDEE